MEAAESPALTFTSLPHDVLVQILQQCDERNVYHLALTCRVLHIAALTVLFAKYAHGIEEGRLELYYYPSFILPAIHGALFVQEFKSISVCIQRGDLRRDLRILRDLLNRTTETEDLRTLTVNFGGRYYFKFGDPPPDYDSMNMLEELRELLEFSIAKGYESLDLQSDANVREQYFPAQTSRIRNSELLFLSLEQKRALSSSNIFKPTLDKPKGKKGTLKTFWHKLHGFFPHQKDPTEITETEPSQDTDQDFFSGFLTPEALETPTPLTPPTEYPLISSYADTRLCSMSLHSQLFFEDPLYDWTFNLILTARLSKVSIYQDSFHRESWVNVLPQLHFPHMQELRYHCTQQILPSGPFTDFLNRHSKHLSRLTLTLYPLDNGYTSPSNAVHWAELNLPALTHLICSPDTFNWIIFAAFSFCSGNPEYHPLPKLEFIYLQSNETSAKYWSQVDQGVLSLSALSKRHIPISPPEEAETLNQDRWLREFDLDCGTCEKFVTWLTKHAEKRQTSPFASFHCLEVLRFHSAYDVQLEDKEMKLILRFVALIPSLTGLSLRTVKMENVKEYGAKYRYWHTLKKACPKLEVVTLNETFVLKMEDLLDDEWAIPDP